MEVKIELAADHVNAAFTGPLSVGELVRAFEAVYGVALDRSSRLILIDCSGLDGELSTRDKFSLGKSAVDYWSSRSGKMIPKIAIAGQAPLVDGFGALVASSGGVNASTFSTVPEALNWLRIR